MPEIGEEDPLVKDNNNFYYWIQFSSWWTISSEVLYHGLAVLFMHFNE